MTNYLETLIINYGILAVFLLMMANGFFSVPPSEIILSLSGVMSSLFPHKFIHVFFAAIIGNLIGTYFLYLVARVVGYKWLFKVKLTLVCSNSMLLRLLSNVIPNENTYNYLASKFRKDGGKWVCIFRCFPVVRSIISLPAGVVKMNTMLFLLCSIAGISIWALIWQLLGYFAIHNWSKYQWYISIPLLLLLLLLLFFFKQRLKAYINNNQVKSVSTETKF